MKITSARFVASAFSLDQYPEGTVPEIAFVGRSNVGKSSLINALMFHKRLAHTSATPGKTQRICFYMVNDILMLVDLPGYGYTRVPQSISRQWRKAVDTYFRFRKNLRAVFQLVDIRHAPTVWDINVSLWLRERSLLGGIIATKADKISRSRQVQALKHIKEKLELDDKKQVEAFSSITKQGRKEVWARILKYM